MTKIGRSLQLIVGVGIWMLERLSAARTAEPTKNPPGAEVPPLEVAKALAQPPGQMSLMSLRAAVQAWAATDPRAALAWVQNFAEDFERWQLTNAILAG